MTLPVGIQRFFTEFATDWPGLMAATFLMSVPVVVLFLVLQKYFVRALTEGAVKHLGKGVRVAEVVLKHVNKAYGAVSPRSTTSPSRSSTASSWRWSALRLRQDHDAQPDRRPDPAHLGRDLHRRPRGLRSRPQGPGHRHGVPELRALPATRRCSRTSPSRCRCASSPRPRSTARCAPRPRSSTSPTCSTASPRELSGGQQQRVALGRALVRDPRGLPDGRAALQPRRQAPRADALGDQALPPQPRRHHHLRHPRPARGRHHGRQDGGDARRLAAAVRHPRAASSPTRSTPSSRASSAARR